MRLHRLLLASTAAVFACDGPTPSTTPPPAAPTATDPPPAEPAKPASLLPADATKLEVANLGGGFVGPSPRGSTCGAGEARHTLDLATRQLEWTTCDFRIAQPQQPASGKRTLTEAEVAEVTAAIAGLSPVDGPECPADAPRLQLSITTPAGARVYDDYNYSACPRGDVAGHVIGLPGLLDVVHRLGHHAQVEADCAAGQAPACAASGWHQSILFKNEAAAVPLLDRACQAGDLVSCPEYALLDIEGDGAKKTQAAEKACAAKIAPGCVVLGNALEHGWWGNKVDKPKAKAAYIRACEAGDEARCPANKIKAKAR